MPDQFVVPQFLDVEAKIIGPITGRQFIILLGTLLADFIIYRIFLSVIPILLLGLPITALGVAFAFARVNGQPLHYLMLSVVQTFRRPMIRVWDKGVSDSELKERKIKEKEEPPAPMPTKEPLESSRLSELSLIVNTGGAYHPEVDITTAPSDDQTKQTSRKGKV